MLDESLHFQLLVTFARKYSIAYQEAENGLQALLTYQQAVDHRFDVILMGKLTGSHTPPFLLL